MKLTKRFRTLFLAAAPVALSAALLIPPALADQPDEKNAPAKPAQTDPSAPAQPDAVANPDAAVNAGDASPAQAASVSPEAKKVIDDVDAAYSKLKTLELAGTFTGDIQAAGQDRKESKKFTASFAAPNKFRHSMENDILVGSTGDKAYAYIQDRNLYTQAEAPKEKAELERLPEPIPQIMQMQNPSLMLALVKSAAAEMTGRFADIKAGGDGKIDGESGAFQSLQLTLPNRIVVTMLFHPETHLLRQARADIRPMLEQQGTPDVKQAVLTVDYTTVTPDAAVKDDQFAWAPPQAARDIAEMAQADAAGAAGDASPASDLEGKAAPDFSLQNMEGQQVSLKGLKGKVVVLDMWATWCGPCRKSLPHLDQLHASVKDKGVNVYAVNLQEDRGDVEQFVKQTNLKTPVLLDTDGAVAQAYKAAAIPQTVVIGKDGKVAKVIVGFNGEQTTKELQQAVEKAMK